MAKINKRFVCVRLIEKKCLQSHLKKNLQIKQRKKENKIV